ncbi:MAG: hypothetical protein ACE5KT_08430 [Methanosarcinales archaeon]
MRVGDQNGDGNTNDYYTVNYTDLNGNGNMTDSILHYYDINPGSVHNISIVYQKYIMIGVINDD